MLHHLINITQEEYPSILREIPDPPERLYVMGGLSQLSDKRVSIVGTRKASREGMRIAERFALSFTKLGVSVISGLASGIDSAAHRGALEAGGVTVAVMGTGIDKIYPTANEGLAHKIIKLNGAVVSEYGPEESFYKGNFLRRNRIISGLSQATLVIEAPERSGSLATARLAGEQGREVFVVPGSIRDTNFRGSHSLIRDGAILVTSPEELLEDMGWWASISFSEEGQEELVDLSSEESMIIEAMRQGGVPLSVDKIIELTKLEPRIVNISLASLTLKGLVLEERSGYKLISS